VIEMLTHGANVLNIVKPIRTDLQGRVVTVGRAADSPVQKLVELPNVNETTLWDPTAGSKWVCTDLIISSSNNATITVRDGTGGTIWLILYIAQNTTVVINLQTPMVSAAANNNLTVQTTAAATSITACGYEI